MSDTSTRQGVLVISLDFELHWEVMDVKSTETYKEQLSGARKAIPKLG